MGFSLQYLTLALRSCDQAWRYVPLVLHDVKVKGAFAIGTPAPIRRHELLSIGKRLPGSVPYGTCPQSSRSICLHLQPQSFRHRTRSTKGTTSSSLSMSRQQSLDFHGGPRSRSHLPQSKVSVG